MKIVGYLLIVFAVADFGLSYAGINLTPFLPPEVGRFSPIAIGLLGGLIFVGLEMRQSQIIALSAQQQSRTELFTGIVNSLNESGDESLFEVLTKVTNNEPLSPAETRVSENYAFQLVWIFENDFIQYRNELIDENVWQAKLYSFRTAASLCHFRGAIDYLLQFMSSELTALVDLVPESECT